MFLQVTKTNKTKVSTVLAV